MKILFANFWTGYNCQKNSITQLLDKFNYKYSIVKSNPDIVIFSVFGNNNTILNSNVKKIFYTGENYRPYPNIDLNLTFDNPLDFNNIRIPLWVFSHIHKPEDISKLVLTPKKDSKFCSFVYSHQVGFRNNFCKKLSQYKKIDCGGSCLNNIGYKVKEKQDFQINYKFCIAYENTSYPGYTTEKIIDAYKANCIPIYYGSPTVTTDFNPETFINAHDFKTEEDLIKYIIKVDNNDELYQSYMNKPIYSKRWFDILNDKNQTFFKNLADKIYN